MMTELKSLQKGFSDIWLFSRLPAGDCNVRKPLFFICMNMSIILKEIGMEIEVIQPERYKT